jgi:hypothetical protein
MRSFRMPIFGLMGIVLACGLAFAAIRSPTFQAVSVTFTVALTILLASIVGSIFGRHRVFWIGFAIFGWGYAILALAPGSWTNIRPYLVTSHLINGLANAMDLPRGGPGVVNWMMRDVPYQEDSGLGDWNRSYMGNRLQRIGHSIATVVHGVAGGVLAVWLANRSRNRGRERGEG